MTKIEVIQFVSSIIATWPSNQFTSATVAVYERMLEPLDVKLANRALEELAMTSHFAPSIAEIHELVRSYASAKLRARLEESKREDQRLLARGDVDPEDLVTAPEWLQAFAKRGKA